MIYGICGASGTGKTTLGEMVAESLCMTFVKTSITAVAARHGFDAVGKFSIASRLKLQRHLLDDHLDVIAKTSRPAILDRTPVDFIGYMLAEVGMHAHEELTEDLQKEIGNYVTDCIAAVKTHYDFLFLLCRLPVYQQAETRPNPNPAYHLHCDILMRGVLELLSRQVSYATINTPDLQIRHNYLTSIIEGRLNELQGERQKARLN